MEKLARFTMIDEDFICEVCKNEVKALGYTARDHCPNCLCSKHVDINPGDRSCNCHGILRPIGIDNDKKSTYKIIYMCDNCKEIKRNKVANDDNMDLIVELISNPISIKREKVRK